MRPQIDDIRTISCWRFQNFWVFVDQNIDFWPRFWPFFHFYEFDSLKLFLGCLERFLKGVKFCSALHCACFEVFGVVFEQKLSEKLMFFCQFFDFQIRVFAISAHFFSKWPSQGATPGQISSWPFHLACLQAFLVFQLLWKSFYTSLFFHYIHWPKFSTDSHLCEAPP